MTKNPENCKSLKKKELKLKITEYIQNYLDNNNMKKNVFKVKKLTRNEGFSQDVASLNLSHFFTILSLLPVCPYVKAPRNDDPNLTSPSGRSITSMSSTLIG